MSRANSDKGAAADGADEAADAAGENNDGLEFEDGEEEAPVDDSLDVD